MKIIVRCINIENGSFARTTFVTGLKIAALRFHHLRVLS